MSLIVTSLSSSSSSSKSSSFLMCLELASACFFISPHASSSLKSSSIASDAVGLRCDGASARFSIQKECFSVILEYLNAVMPNVISELE